MLVNEKDYQKENLLLFFQRLEKKCHYFDNGDESIAIDMAVQIRTLLHDTDGSVSLLKRLGEKDIDFIDTSTPGWDKPGLRNCSFGNNFSGHTVFSQPYPRYALSQNTFNSECPQFEPTLGLYKNKTQFNKWWHNAIYLMDKNKSLKRCDVILALCNKDGGAHYDKYKKLPYKYLFLKNKNTLNIVIDGKETVSENFPLFVIVRQIAYEVLETLKPLVEEYSKK